MSCKDFGGLIIRPKIRAEIIQDSTLAWASKVFENTLLAIPETTRRNVKEKI
jgi:hypothetical protein